MKKVVAKTLQEAITQASVELGCSVTELDYEIIQTPSSGFFGMGRKDAIIVATIIEHSPSIKKDFAPKREIPKAPPREPQNRPTSSTPPKPSPKPAQPVQVAPMPTPIMNDEEDVQIVQRKSRPSYFDHHLGVDTQEYHGGFESKNGIEEVFFKEIQDPNQITHEIEAEIKALFAVMPYKIDKIEVGIYDNRTLLVTIDGEDSALMIGEKGYRYKALSYLLFNWIHPKYGYNVRLEIAQFLKNQEEAIDVYLQSIISTIAETGKAQTKPLDGVLAYIALKKLRDTFPNKYVSFRINAQDERYIIVSDFNKNG